MWDVSQTEGEPIPEFARVSGDPGENTGRLKALVESKGIKLQYLDNLRGDGASMGGTIVVRTGLTPAEEFSVLTHELAHELIHRRIDKGKESRPPKTVRETEAEAVAFVVGEAIGLENGTAASDYIQLYRGNAATLGESLQRIQQTASEIIAALTPDPEPDAA